MLAFTTLNVFHFDFVFRLKKIRSDNVSILKPVRNAVCICGNTKHLAFSVQSHSETPIASIKEVVDP